MATQALLYQQKNLFSCQHYSSFLISFSEGCISYGIKIVGSVSYSAFIKPFACCLERAFVYWDWVISSLLFDAFKCCFFLRFAVEISAYWNWGWLAGEVLFNNLVFSSIPDFLDHNRTASLTEKYLSVPERTRLFNVFKMFQPNCNYKLTQWWRTEPVSCSTVFLHQLSFCLLFPALLLLHCGHLQVSKYIQTVLQTTPG